MTLITLIYTDQKSSMGSDFEFVKRVIRVPCLVRFAFWAKQIRAHPRESTSFAFSATSIPPCFKGFGFF